MNWFKSLAQAASTGETHAEWDKHVPKSSFTLAELTEAVSQALSEAATRSSSHSPRCTTEGILRAADVCLEKYRTSREDDETEEIITLTPGVTASAAITTTPEDDKDTAAAAAAAVRELARLVAEVITPPIKNKNKNKHNNNDDQEEERLPNFHANVRTNLALPGLSILHTLSSSSSTILTSHPPLEEAETPVLFDDETYLTLIAFADDKNHHNNDNNNNSYSSLVKPILERHHPWLVSDGGKFIVERVLQGYLRPLFSKSKPASITSSGRKAEYRSDDDAKANSRGQTGLAEDDAETKPWKFGDLRAVPVVNWVVGNADDSIVSKNWPLFIPVLLTLVDDPTTPIRRQGLANTTNFLTKFPTKTLNDTGLLSVFEDAIFPTLSFLPSLTPEDESVQLLIPAYEALLCLSSKLAAGGGAQQHEDRRYKMLDKILRDGVFAGYSHAKDHVRIVEVLCNQTVTILCQMEIYAVKHLKDLIPMVSTIMTDPFAPSSPTTLLSSIKALQAILANCWPRILPNSPWLPEIINALVLCWLNVAEHDKPTPDHATISQELVNSAKILAAILEAVDGEDKEGKENFVAAVRLSDLVAPLVEKEGRLAGLFSASC